MPQAIFKDTRTELKKDIPPHISPTKATALIPLLIATEVPVTLVIKFWDTGNK